MTATLGVLLASTIWLGMTFVACQMVFQSYFLKRFNRIYQWPSDRSIFTDRLPDLTPRFLHNLFFAFNATNLIESGYQKLKQTTFQFIRGDGNAVVLPVSLLEELSMLPASIASPNGALEHDLLGEYSGTALILDSRMHHTVVQRKLTPRLPLITPGLEEELNESFKQNFPQSEEWGSFMPYQSIAKISASLAARTMVGPDMCRNPAWLDISINFTESLFRTVVMLRFLPPWLRGVFCYLLPSYWHGKTYVKRGKALLVPKLTELLQKVDDGTWTPQNTEEDLNVLSWLAEAARTKDRNPETLAHVEVLLALASVHTTLLRMVNVLYDIAAEPELIEELRAEINAEHFSEGGWDVSSYSRLEKLDSVMRESQRLSPPSILGMKRIFSQAYNFADGTHIPKGTYVCMPVYAIQNDPQNTENPMKYDGLRAYRLRQAAIQAELATQADSETEGKVSNSTDHAFQFSTPDKSTLHFGYGRSACPGRHFASLAIKMLLVKVLCEYDFKFMPGKSRPRNWVLHEFLFSWPWTKMMVRRRKDGVCPF